MEEILGDYLNNYEDIYSNDEDNKIFKAYNKIKKRKCCLKVINKNQLKLGDYDYLLEQIKREEEITKLCNSEYTVNFYQKFENENNIIFELEYFDDDLKDYLFNNDDLKNDEFFKEIVISIGKALKIIHEKGIMHRDIKPYNIFIKELENENRIIKLGDFGSSIYIKDNNSEPIGTILYIAPEIMKNIKYDEKCDLWSLGVTLFELYFGISPFGLNPTPASIKKAIYNEEKFIFLKSGIPTLDILFKRLLTINPEERMSFNEFFNFIFSKDFMQKNVIALNNNIEYKKIYEKILLEPPIEYEDQFIPEKADEKEIQKRCVKKILTYVEGDHLPDIMSYPNGSINEEQTFNNIIYYDENINFLSSINKDSDYFERNTSGAFILCTNIESLKLIKKEIIKEVKNDKRISFNLITTGSTFEKIMGFLEENKDFKECIVNACIYCYKLEKYLPLANKYTILHDDIYNKQDQVVNFIKMFSAKEIKPFPITKLISYYDYKDKYKDRHFKISQFYGNLTKDDYKKYYNEMKQFIEEKSKSKELKKNENILSEAFCSFDLEKDLEELDKLIIKEYTKNTFHGDLNKWLMNTKMNFYEPIAYFTARLMYSLNNYASNYNMYCCEERSFHRGVQLTYCNLLPYERAKGKIILLSAFTSTTESELLAKNWAGRNKAKDVYKANLKFSVVFIITNLYKNGWISSGINIQKESVFPNEKEYLFQPFTFYYVRNVQIDLENYTADIYLETVGKLEILEEKIKYNKGIHYSKKENIIVIKN